MLKFIDIAARTGQPPVRALLSRAVGSTDPDVLLNHEIRYRNDQFHAIYGLYEGDEILGIVGLARDPGQGKVEIMHFAVAGPPFEPGLAQTLVDRAMSLTDRGRYSWNVAAEYEETAIKLGFRRSDTGTWFFDRRQ